MGSEALAMAQDVLRQAGDIRALAVLSASQRATLELLAGPGTGAEDSLPGCPALNMTGLLLEAEAAARPGSGAGASDSDLDGAALLSRAANERLLAYVTDVYLPHLQTQRAAAVYDVLNVSVAAPPCRRVCVHMRVRHALHKQSSKVLLSAAQPYLG